MFKQIITLFRGAAVDAGEEFTDRHAIALLRQQIRDCANGVAASRKAVAVAIAQNEREAIQHKKLEDNIADLEARTLKAMGQGEEKLALEAAETISLLEAERDVSAQAQAQFNAEITRLKNTVRNAELKLKELQRGQRLAVVTDKTQRMREVHPSSGLSDLKEAEETLLRLRVRQKQIDTTANAMAEMAETGDPASITEKLAEAGCGDPLKSSAQDVLDRLKKKSKKKAA